MSPLARLLYQGLWCYAADCGHLDDEPFELKMRILPADNCDVEELLGELSDTGRIQRKDGAIYLPKLSDHARIDKRYETVCERCKARREHAEKAAPQPPEPAVTTQGSRREPAVTTCAQPPQHDADGDGDGDGDVMVKKTGASAAAPAAPPSTALAVIPDDEPTAQSLVAEWIDHCAAKPPRNVVGQVAKHLKAMLDEGIDPDRLRAGLAEWNRKGVHPSVLPSVVHEVANKRAGPTSRNAEWRAMQERQMARAIERERQMGIQR
ncbi:MAG TPA: hypothetical protein VFJ19_16050 [Nocardioidaceae bacterium]|nr:hypothetical protein [Nocardioidaceae bacterium]